MAKPCLVDAKRRERELERLDRSRFEGRVTWLVGHGQSSAIEVGLTLDQSCSFAWGLRSFSYLMCFMCKDSQHVSCASTFQPKNSYMSEFKTMYAMYILFLIEWCSWARIDYVHHVRSLLALMTAMGQDSQHSMQYAFSFWPNNSC